ncbi:MAG: conjugal transfer protein TraF [Endomicrobiaceae bacterium]|nr:conjugal transfer protein TraF [Endomicrobiaceae bacterium]
MKKSILSFFITMFLVSIVYADKWQTVGARAVAMGGAGVAVANGADVQYWNPANLAIIKDIHNNEIGLIFGGEIETTGKTLSMIDQLTQMADKYSDVAEKIDNNLKATAEDIATIFEGFSVIAELQKSRTGALIDLNAGIFSRLKKLSFSFRIFGTSGITPFIDTVNIGIGSPDSGGLPLDDFDVRSGYEQYANDISTAIDNAGIQSSLTTLLGLSDTTTSEQMAAALINMALDVGASESQISQMTDIIVAELPKAADIINAFGSESETYDKNETQVLVDAGVFTECSVGYGEEVFRGILVGTNLKIIQGQMAQTSVMILKENEKMEDAINEALKNRQTTTQLAVDLGATFDFSRFFEKKILFDPKFALVVKNINSPAFNRPARPLDAPDYLIWKTDSYSLDRQIRAGIALNPLENLIFACDIDVVANKTMVEDFNSQELAFGLEYNILNKKYINIPLRLGLNKNIANNGSWVYTGGFGILTGCVFLDFAGAISSQTTTLDGNSIPSSAEASFTLGARF